MTRTMSLFAAGAMVVTAPALAMAPPGGSTPNGPHIPSPTTAPGNGQTNGQGYNHMHTQAQAKGQPNQDCEALGTTPGNAATAPGGGSPFGGETSKGGSHYAGSQGQNSRNSASVSQYDVACANQPH
jgi:hypothetical protein